MSIWGKVIFAMIGSFLFGPVGFLLGLWLGHSFDKRLNRRIAFFNFAPHASSGNLTDVQAIFFESTFQVMGHIAKSDGRVSESEIHAAQSIMRELNLDTNFRREAIEAFDIGKMPGFDLNQALDKLNEACHHYQQLLMIFLELQQQAARADGYITAHKQRLLQHIAKKLGVTSHSFFHSRTHDFHRQYNQQRRTTYRQTSRHSPHDLQAACELLGVTTNTNEVQLKKAYRKLMSQNHPDKLVSKGLPEEMIKLANQKTHEIKKAYDLVRKAKGFQD